MTGVLRLAPPASWPRARCWLVLLLASAVTVAELTAGLAVATAQARGQTSGPAADERSGPLEASATADGGRGRAGASLMTMMVVPASTEGIEPVVGERATAQVREDVRAAGYATVPDDLRQAALRRIVPDAGLTPADVWRLAYVAAAHRAVGVRVWAAEGRYRFELVVASLDGSGPFVARGDGSATTLLDALSRQLKAILGALEPWDGSNDLRAVRDRPASTQGGTGQSGGTGPSGGTGQSGQFVEDPFRADVDQPPVRGPRYPSVSHPAEHVGGGAPGHRSAAPMSNGRPELAPLELAPPERRWSLALQTEGAIGIGDDGFYNHLVSARLNYRFSRDLSAGASLAYANLRGRNQRAHNLLPMLQLAHRVRLLRRSELTIPLRVAAGYLPYNGPLLRFSAGINIPLSEHLELGFDLLAPTLWVLPDRAAVSMNVAVEVNWFL